MTQLYWQVFKNLEREFLDIADMVFVNDKQQGVYSMHIADLLIRTVVEIESISKELYLSNGGDARIPDQEMKFDYVCLDHLEGLWKLGSKKVFVVSPNLYLEDETNKVLQPLRRVNEWGKPSWKKAYQAVKHNRVRCLANGNIKNFLHALAGLYVLNLYYKEEQLYNMTESERLSVDLSFGSSLFAVKIHKCFGGLNDGVYEKKEDYDECIYLEDYEVESKETAMKALEEVNDYLRKQAEPELIRIVQEKKENGEEITEEWIQRTSQKLFFEQLPIKDYQLSLRFKNCMSGLRYNLELNKQQY